MLISILNRVEAISEDVQFRPNYTWDMERQSNTLCRVRVKVVRPDALTGETGTGHGGWRYFMQEMSDDAIVRSLFSLLLAYEEHEVREFFKYKNKRVFGPHITLNALMEVADTVG